jgi:hypothetical protein
VSVLTDPESSYFVSRNGAPNISQIEAFLATDGESVVISVYNRKGVELHSGGRITVEAMDELAAKWIEARKTQSDGQA